MTAASSAASLFSAYPCIDGVATGILRLGENNVRSSVQACSRRNPSGSALQAAAFRRILSFKSFCIALCCSIFFLLYSFAFASYSSNCACVSFWGFISVGSTAFTSRFMYLSKAASNFGSLLLHPYHHHFYFYYAGLETPSTCSENLFLPPWRIPFSVADDASSLKWLKVSSTLWFVLKKYLTTTSMRRREKRRTSRRKMRNFASASARLMTAKVVVVVV